MTTHWSVVRAAADGGASADASVALEKLCANYWQSLYFYVRRKGHDEQEAQDLTQEFFSRLLARNDFAGLDPRQGRFRAFLLAAMNHFLANEGRRAATLKRGGGEANLAFDTVIAEQVYATQPAADSSAEKLFDRQWAEAVLTRSAQALRQEFTDAGRSSLFAELNVFLSVPAGAGEYGPVASRLDMTEAAVAKAVERLRRRYRELVRGEIGQTVSTAADLEGEMRYLLEVLA